MYAHRCSFFFLHFNFLQHMDPGVHVTCLWCMLFFVETLCGNPPVIESTEQVWDSNSTPGSTVLYVCKEGFYNQGGDNVSICNENAQWTPPTLSCQGNSNNDWNPLKWFSFHTWNGRELFLSFSAMTYCVANFRKNDLITVKMFYKTKWHRP